MEVKPGYKLTEVGAIPEEWSSSVLTTEIREMTDFVAAGSFESLRNNVHVYDTHNFALYVRLFDLRLGLGHSSQKYVDKASYEFLSKSNLFGNELLVANIGANVGETFLMPISEGRATIAPNMIVVRPDDRKLRHDFLFYYTKSNFGLARIRELIAGSGQPKLNKTDLKRLKVLIPPIPEQRAIAAALGDVDAMLVGLDQLIAKKRDLKQAAMQQLLVGKMRLPGFSGEWEVKRLGEVANFYKGKGLPKSAISSFGTEPCIHYGELFTRYPETISEIISRTDMSDGTFRSVTNDVLMPTSDVTPRGLAKASCLRADGVILGGDILVIRSDTKLIFGSFLSYLIRYEEEQVLQLVTGSTVFHLYGSDMKKFTFSMPSLSEQTAIATVLSDMDAELSALEIRRDKIRALKQAMMQELLTGKTRLVSPEVTYA